MSRFKYRPSYRRNLPHIQPPNASFFLTFRLSSSLPGAVVKQWNLERQWLRQLAETNPNYFNEVKHEFDRRWFAKFEVLLDEASVGPTWLKNTQVASMVADSLHHRDGKVYRLDGFTVMSNHVHTVFKPLPRTPVNSLRPSDVEYFSLASIMHSLKGYTAYQANRILVRDGEFWAHESYDHWIRDYPEWQRIVAYVLNNPVKPAAVARGETGSGVMFAGNEGSMAELSGRPELTVSPETTVTHHRKLTVCVTFACEFRNQR